MTYTLEKMSRNGMKIVRMLHDYGMTELASNCYPGSAYFNSDMVPSQYNAEKLKEECEKLLGYNTMTTEEFRKKL